MPACCAGCKPAAQLWTPSAFPTGCRRRRSLHENLHSNMATAVREQARTCTTPLSTLRNVAAGTTPLPRSLANIFREMRNDIGDAPTHGDLTHWARQGVLLLNPVLSVPEGRSHGHKALGWQALARQVLARVAQKPTAFLLGGQPAQKLADPLIGPEHLAIRSAHPSPLSARRGFFGSRPFSRVNDWLATRHETPIDWRG